MKVRRWKVLRTVAVFAVCLLAVNVQHGQAEPMIVNGDFESDVEGFVVWPGYVGNGNPDAISGWRGGGSHGINPIEAPHDVPAPFRDNGDNDTHVAFLQGESFIEQDITGLAVGTDYVLSLDFNSRNCCGDMPIADVLFNGQVIASSADVFGDPGAIPPVGDANAWYHADIPFTAPVDAITLQIAARPSAGGDATLLLDNINLQVVPEPATGMLAIVGLLGLLGVARRKV